MLVIILQQKFVGSSWLCCLG